MTPEIRRLLNELKDNRLENERSILFDYYRHKLGKNEDARGMVRKHFTHAPNPWWEHVMKSTKHWNNLDNER